MNSFPGFPKEGLAFLRALKRNNNREWFQARKPVYDEQVKAPMAALVDALNGHLARTAPDFVTEPGKAIYRIYRDTRFSKDKTPYKTAVAASLTHRRLVKHDGAGLYLAVSPDGVQVGGGIYLPGPETIRALREVFAECGAEFRALFETRRFRGLMGDLLGDRLTRVPKGYPGDHPESELLRGRQWYFFVTLDVGLATTPKALTEIWKRFEVMLPALNFLNAPLLAQRKKESARAMF